MCGESARGRGHVDNVVAFVVAVVAFVVAVVAFVVAVECYGARVQ